jgi:4'-phosphopantetheinyl transferase
MKLAYLDIREAHISFSNPYWVRVIPKSLLSFIHFEREPITLSHSIAGRYLLWQLLVQNGYHNFADFELHKTPEGKIFFLHKIQKFNISHSGDLVVCALSDEFVMGLDIEKILPVPLDDFKNIMSENEWKEISGSEGLSAFYRLWTMKEAVCKAEGIGLINELNNLNPEIEGCFFPHSNTFWHLHEIQVPHGYSCHLAVQKKMTNLDLKKIIPLG